MHAHDAAPGTGIPDSGKVIDEGNADSLARCPRCGGPTLHRLDINGTEHCGKCLTQLAAELRTRGLDDLADAFGIGDLSDVPDDELYAACLTKSNRATKQEMAARNEALIRIVDQIKPCTVRQVFYQATVHNVVEKTEAGYDKVQRGLVDLRISGRIPFRSITDNTRWQIKPTSYDSLSDALQEAARLYRRAVWSDVDAYVEFWLEKDALAGVIHPITGKYDVPLMVARGFSSISFLHSAAEDIAELDKPAYIYHLGDHDPSGVCAAQKIEQTLRKFAPDAEIHFQRLAVLPHQISSWDLPTRPTKKTDTRAKNFRGDSVELDAVHPDRLRYMVEMAILGHLPDDQMRVLKVAEDSEREMLQMFAKDAA